MRIATWNVNSLRVRLPHLLDWLGDAEPDVVALQETKTPDADFPNAEIAAAGYSAAYAGQRTYNGVATLTRTPAAGVLTELPDLGDAQRRFLALTTGGVRVVNVYAPNGERVGSEKFGYKLFWFEKLIGWLAAELEAHPKLVLLGDLNVAPEPIDVHDPSAWQGQVLFSEDERAAFRRLIDTGLVDAFRLFPQPSGEFSWWDYRMGAFRRNHGLRIDHILVSAALRDACISCRIDRGPRRRERPSDHAPVIAELCL